MVHTLPSWTVNQAGYLDSISASGVGSLSFSATGTLPPGLTLSSTGLLSGAPVASGVFTFTVTATDSLGSSANQSFTITINPPPMLQPASATLPIWTVDQAGYSQTFNAAGGTGTSTFSATGTLPPGLTL